MSVSQYVPTEHANLELQITRQIEEQTWGHLRDLHVELQDERVVLRGHAGSYYLKQRALVAAQQVLEQEALALEVVPAIEVVSGACRPAEGRER